MIYKCECCAYEGDFTTAEEAFQAGWDAPPHFTDYVCCNLCPGAFVVLRQTWKHAAAHERWAKEGRPAKFTQDDLRPQDQIPEEDLSAFVKYMNGLKKEDLPP